MTLYIEKSRGRWSLIEEKPNFARCWGTEDHIFQIIEKLKSGDLPFSYKQLIYIREKMEFPDAVIKEY